MSDVMMFGRPTVYRGIRMRSRLEAKWAASFDEGEVDWEYEPICFADERRQYLPDFRLGGVCYVEVKGVVRRPLAVMYQMEVILASEAEASLEIWEGPPGGDGRQWCGRRYEDRFLWIDLNDSRMLPMPELAVREVLM